MISSIKTQMKIIILSLVLLSSTFNCGFLSENKQHRMLIGETVELLDYFEVVDPSIHTDIINNKNALHFFPGITYQQENDLINIGLNTPNENFQILPGNRYLKFKSAIDDKGNIRLKIYFLKKLIDGNRNVSFEEDNDYYDVLEQTVNGLLLPCINNDCEDKDTQISLIGINTLNIDHNANTVRLAIAYRVNDEISDT